MKYSGGHNEFLRSLITRVESFLSPSPHHSKFYLLYLYVLREFKKMVLASENVKNTHNLIR